MTCYSFTATLSIAIKDIRDGNRNIELLENQMLHGSAKYNERRIKQSFKSPLTFKMSAQVAHATPSWMGKPSRLLIITGIKGTTTTGKKKKNKGDIRYQNINMEGKIVISCIWTKK